MEKLTEKLNSIVVSKSTKENLIKIAEKEQLYIQQVCRKLLQFAINEYLSNPTTKKPL
jgi:uncharacterized membrane protein